MPVHRQKDKEDTGYKAGGNHTGFIHDDRGIQHGIKREARVKEFKDANRHITRKENTTEERLKITSKQEVQ